MTDVCDIGTKELSKHHLLEPHVIARSLKGDPVKIGVRVKDQLPIDRYYVRGLLDKSPELAADMYASAKRLMSDFFASGHMPRVCGSFEPRIKGNTANQDDFRLDAEDRYKKALLGVGITLRSILVSVVCLGETAQDWAIMHNQHKDAGITVLRMALLELGDYYARLNKTRNIAKSS